MAGTQGDSSWDTLKCFTNCQGAEARSWYFFSYSGGANLPYNKQMSYTCQFHNFVQTYNYSFPAVKLHLIVWCSTLTRISGRGVFWGFSNAAPTDKSATEIMRALKLHSAFTVHEKADCCEHLHYVCPKFCWNCTYDVLCSMDSSSSHPWALCNNESSQYLLTREINDQVQRSLIVRQALEDRTARVVEHKLHSAPEGQEEEAQSDLGFNSTRLWRYFSKRSACCLGKKKKKKKHSLGYFRSLSCNTVSHEEADLSVSAKFTVFPFPFQILFSNLRQNYCHPCQLSVYFGDAPAASQSVSEKNGKSITEEDKA